MDFTEKGLAIAKCDVMVAKMGFRKDASVKIYEWFKKHDMDFGGMIHYFIYEPTKYIGLFMSILNDDLDIDGFNMLKSLDRDYTYKRSKKASGMIDDYINKI